MKSLLEDIDLMTYTINFNYQKKAVYHTFFGVFISMCLYACIIVLFRYFAKDFINKSNPRIIYQETEFTDSFTIPINFILQEYKYIIYFDTKENIFNLNSTEGNDVPKVINASTNDLFYFTLSITDKINLTELILIDKIDIQSKRIYKNEGEFFFNYIQFNNIDRKFNLKISNYTDLSEIKFEKNIFYDDYNLTIKPGMFMQMKITHKTKLENVISFFSITFMDRIINVNNLNFFRNYTDGKILKFDDKLNILQLINLNYGVVKLIDESGIIFSEIKQNFSLKKNYDSFDSNYIDKEALFNIEFSPIMKQYERIYKKLQNVFADIGGLFNSLILIGNFLVAQFNKSKFDYNLINKTFFLENEVANNNDYQNKNINLNQKNKYRKLFQNLLFVKSIKNPFNKQNISKLNVDSKIMIKNNPYSNKSIIENNSSKISKINDLIRAESIRTKKIDESCSRLKIELKENKKKEDIKSEEGERKEICFKSQDMIEKDKTLEKKIELLLDNKNKRYKKKFVKLSRFEFFLRFLPCKMIKNRSLIEREELISKGEEKIAEYLDVCSYTKLIENFEKLKMILLNNYQKLSFEFLKNRNPSDVFKEDFNSKILETIKYYKQRIEELNLNVTDKNMLEYFGKEFKDLIIF